MTATTFQLRELAGLPTGRYRLDTASDSSSPASGLPVVTVQGGLALGSVKSVAGDTVLWAKRLAGESLVEGFAPVRVAADGVPVGLPVPVTQEQVAAQIADALANGNAASELPAPMTGDAGKVLTVNEAEDGFDLAPPPAGSLRAPDPSEGYNGALGLDTINPVTVPHGNANFVVPMEEAYTLGASGPTTSNVDDANMAWNTTDPGPATLTVKQGKWYVVGWELDFDAPLDAALKVAIGGKITFDIAAGRTTEANRGPVLYVPTNENVAIALDASALSSDASMNYAALYLFPLS